MIKFQSYSINNLLLTNQVLDAYITNFWNDVFSQLIKSSDKHLLLMCKVEFNNSELGYRTLGELRRVNFDDKEMFIKYLIARLGVLTEAYVTHPISKITFSYFIKDGLATEDRRLLQDSVVKGLPAHRFNNMNLPISMNPSDYGDVILDNYVQIGGENVHRFLVENGTRSYIIDTSSDGLTNKVRIQGAINLSWVDTKISAAEDIFSRAIGKSIIYFMGGEKVLSKKVLNAKPFTKVAVDSQLDSKFITMDIETIKLQDKITPYLICAYNGSESIFSYADSSLVGEAQQKALFSSFINQLLTFFNNESKTMVVYAHNFSGFDGILLMKHLLNIGNIKPLIFHGKLMSIKIKLNIDGYKGKTIIFKDSFLLLPFKLLFFFYMIDFYEFTIKFSLFL